MRNAFRKVAGAGLGAYGGAVAYHGLSTAAVVGGPYGAGAFYAGVFGLAVAGWGLNMFFRKSEVDPAPAAV